MTLTDASLHIAAALLGGALAATFVWALSVVRRRYQGRTPEPYAGYRTGAHTGTGELRWLECKGDCPGTTTHETAGDGEATCVQCGTPRMVPAPDAV
ncbi:hypothetical protein [Streptomyces scabiei]|uniref:hypothetical protein n=1 Tax=Streptomyces scabiei TaxID=1930 RepID=UPI001B31E8B5|nr:MULTISPECIES: hypothetical protein [Streptomyces]MBP5890619.1 hypothetical protein [Streptomyces sp. LBUM 1481]MBP5920751.1 hypothetical protein [Streptomyces sp. LBUM 1483]MDX2538854.1 hypothetical protein [Streptomyces scabiei]MDX2802327.1 hypothetical protein [Streptomyces scabiei]MDX3295006.1 hypothetical protein [Streptomyces scabiei]